MAIEKEINIVVKEKGLETINKKVKELNVNVKEVDNSTKNFQSTSDKSSKNSIFSQLKDGAQQLLPALKSAESGLVGVGNKMWELVKNPVGLMIAGVVVSLKFLYEAFQSSIAGGKEIKQVFAGLKSTGDQVKDAIFGLGRSLIDVTEAAYKFITLDFKGASESMKKANKEASNSYSQLSNAIDGTTYSIFKNLEARQQVNDKARKVFTVTQSETNKLLVQSREILTDETSSIKDKKKALEEVTKAEKDSSKEKVRIAKEDLEILKAKAKGLGGEAEKKMKGEIRDATIALNEAETENAMTGIKLNKQRKMLLREEISDAKALSDAKKAKLKEESDAKKIADDLEAKRLEEKAKSDAQKLYDTDQQAKQAMADVDALSLKRQEDKNERESTDSANKIAIIANEFEKEKEFNNKLISEEERLKSAKEGAANFTIDLIKQIAGKNKSVAIAMLAVEKGLAIAQIVSSAGKSIANATANLAAVPAVIGVVPNPMYAVQAAATIKGIAATKISAATSIASILAQSITTGKGIISGGNESGGSSTGSSAPSAPSFNLVQGTGTNQIAQGLSQQGIPIKAYVVGSDVSSVQSRDRNIVSEASLG